MNTEEKLKMVVELLEEEEVWLFNCDNYLKYDKTIAKTRSNYIKEKLEELKKSDESEAGIAINKCVGCGKIPKINHQAGSKHFYISCHDIEAIGYTIGECILNWNMKIRPSNPPELEFVSKKEFYDLKEIVYRLFHRLRIDVAWYNNTSENKNYICELLCELRGIDEHKN